MEKLEVSYFSPVNTEGVETKEISDGDTIQGARDQIQVSYRVTGIEFGKATIKYGDEEQVIESPQGLPISFTISKPSVIKELDKNGYLQVQISVTLRLLRRKCVQLTSAMRVHKMADEKFKRNASPFGLGRSKEAQDFATRASNNLLPWIKEHYHIYVATRTGADPFTPAGLYNYHLRGDYYLGLTKDDIRLDQVGLHNNSNPTRLAHIAQTARAFDGNESIDLVTSIDREPEFNGTELYESLLGAAEDISSAASAHFFTREVANGSILTEFLFAEQATMAYKLLPYMKDFHTGVKKFLVNEALHFIDNINSLRNRGINKDTTHNVHHAFRLDATELSARLDATGLSHTSIPTISIDGTTIDFAVNIIGLCQHLASTKI